MSDANGAFRFRSLVTTPGAGFRALAIVALLATTGCGVTYNSPAVRPGDKNVPVSVVELNPASVSAANRSAYTPRSLPEVFHAAAGAGNYAAAGALPGAPFVPEERPQRMEFRPLPTIDPQPYQIGIGDVILLATRGASGTIEQLSGLLAAQNRRQGYTVRDDGAIAIPGVGTVPLVGMTLQQAEDKLFQALVEKQIDPSFSIEVAEFNSKRVVIGGAVKSAKLVPITLQPLTLGEALTAAGGITLKDEAFATIRIYRDGALYQIPLETFRAQSDLQKKLLVSGDAVYVDSTYDLDRAVEFYKQKLDVISLRSSTRTSALSALETEISLRRAALDEQRKNFESRVKFDAEDRDYVYLTGEVKNQSRTALPYDRQATLADVLYDQGGFDTTTGNPAEIYVLRASPEPKTPGEITAYHLNAGNAANIVIATRMQMRPNDVIFIEEQPITKWSRALQQLFPVLMSTASSSL